MTKKSYLVSDVAKLSGCSKSNVFKSIYRQKLFPREQLSNGEYLFDITEGDRFRDEYKLKQSIKRKKNEIDAEVRSLRSSYRDKIMEQHLMKNSLK